jgi:adenylate cyclase
MLLTLKRLFWEWRGVWISTPSIAALVLILRSTSLLQSAEWAAYDQYFRLRILEPRDDRIVIVGINEADVQNLGQAIIPDGVYAKLLEKLKARHPKAIGLDIYRDQRVEPGHQELVRVFESSPNLVGIQKVVGNSSRETVPPPPVLKAKGQVGANDLLTDEDGKVRRGLLYVADRDGKPVPSFSLYLALLYLEAFGIAPQSIEGTQNWQLGKTTVVRFGANDGGYVRAPAGGYQVLLNYREPGRRFDTVSLTDILEDRVSPDWGRDRIILIGAVGESFQDLFFTPYTRSPSQRMAGVEIHANLASQIISAALDGRSVIKTCSEPWEALWILFWSGVGATLSWRLRYAGGMRSLSFQGVSGLFLAGAALLIITYTAFLDGWWIPVVPPFLAVGGSAIAITAYIAHTAKEIRKTFGRYLTDQVVANLLENPEGLKLGGERRKLTILTSDIRGFTAQSERLSPEEVIKIINLYLGYMTEVITKYQGTIDEFMGDGILVLFGAPTTREDDAERAVACAIAMQLTMSTINEKMKELNLPSLEMGIGINTGEVVVGNIGSETRCKYGVVGSQVNLAYRIESYTTGGEILISEATLKEVGSIVRIDGQKQVLAKGVKEPFTIYQIGGISGEYNLSLPQEEEVFLPLLEEIPIQYMLLEGKHLSNTLLRGSLVQLSAKGAKVRCGNGEQQGVPDMLSNLKLNLLTPNNQLETSGDVYAKVYEKPAEIGSFYIHFTAKPPEVEARLDVLYKLIQVQ